MLSDLLLLQLADARATDVRDELDINGMSAATQYGISALAQTAYLGQASHVGSHGL